ncbi:PilZ domain-containing protein [Halorhodospira sp. 9622]|uniref:PilZ domain-containing protein n=1 Tax=Halorhodospira sp. 9622 TaxID=2899136 RepID=UPI001EE98F4B|nr:PilZ domain-containing protein [Halorhodospira sp. 9622]MCG5538175.1 PilZ domain-containing protein [Halorhodospira sp. 9622]
MVTESARAAMDARRELRRPVESIALPFLGSRGEALQPFQYLLHDVSSGGLGIFLPDWLASRERLREGDQIFFHVPFRFGERILNRGYVAWQRWSAEEGGQWAGAPRTSGTPLPYPLYIALDAREIRIDLGRFETSEALAQRIVHDSVLLKRGVLIYLRHLEALFSRVSELRGGDYRVFREEIIGDVRQRILRSVAYLEQFDPQSNDDTAQPPSPIIDAIDLDEFRAAMEPELPLELFNHALGAESTRLYLESIKKLEHRLYLNHNAYVMIYIAGLQPQSGRPDDAP